MRSYGKPTNWRHFSQVNLEKNLIKDKRARRKEKERSFQAVLHKYAKRMIKNPSPLEITLYGILSELDVHYLTQEIIGRFIVDVLIRPDLIIEADGFYHEAYAQRQRDLRRDKELKALGYNVLHLRRHEFYNLKKMTERIKEYLAQSAPMIVNDCIASSVRTSQIVSPLNQVSEARLNDSAR